MFLRRYQWVLGIVWIAVAILFLLREYLLPDAVLKHIRAENAPLIVLMAIVFAGWNFARWYAYINSRKPQSMENPLRSHHDRDPLEELDTKESLPEFDPTTLETQDTKQIDPDTKKSPGSS